MSDRCVGAERPNPNAENNGKVGIVAEGMIAAVKELLPCTFVDVLRRRAAMAVARQAYHFTSYHGRTERTTSLSFDELDVRARQVASCLESTGIGVGERAMLLAPPGLEFLAGLFGCFYAGVVAVPVHPARTPRNRARLDAIVRDAAPAALLSSSASGGEAPCSSLVSVPRIDTESTVREPLDWEGPTISSDALAVLQYTSGSTGSPKGVRLTHANLIANSESIRIAFGLSEKTVQVSWLPPYHDMGLVGGILQGLYTGYPVYLSSPISFAQRPVRWLEAVSRHRATLSGGPNFAFELCVQKARDEECAALDLSSWDVAFCGAEPIRAETLQAFARAFADCGFRESALHPCYGMAEATLLVTAGPWHERTVRRLRRSDVDRGLPFIERPSCDADDVQAYVSSGTLQPGIELRIVDPDTCELRGAEQVGEIWIDSASVSSGYWSDPADQAPAFSGMTVGNEHKRYLRSGDLGFISDGQLFVTGRRKDLIIVHGQNHYPQDIEATIKEAHAAMARARVAAFPTEVRGEERLLVACEVHPQAAHMASEIIAAIRIGITVEHELSPAAVVLVKPGSIPITPTGKIQRRACREQFESGTWSVVAAWSDDEGADESRGSSGSVTGAEALLERIAHLARIRPDSIDRAKPLALLGLDSLGWLEIQALLEHETGLQVPLEHLLERSVVELLRHAEQALPSKAYALAPPRDAADLPLSSNQQALWLFEQMQPGKCSYTLARAARVRSSQDWRMIRAALRAVARRHPALRTRLVFADSAVRQRSDGTAEGAVSVVHVDESEQDLLDRVGRAARQPIDPRTERLFQAVLFVRPGDGIVLLVKAHHLIADSWSFALIVRDLEYAMSGRVLPDTASDYEDSLRALLAREDRYLSVAADPCWLYWSTALADLPDDLAIPSSVPVPSRTYERGLLAFALDSLVHSQLRELAAAQGCTLYTITLSAFQLLLHRVSGQQDLIVGSPFLRRGAGDRECVGYFANALPLRSKLVPGASLGDFIQLTRTTVLGAISHSDISFPKLVQRMRMERPGSAPPTFRAMFQLHERMGRDDFGRFAIGLAGGRIDLGDMELESLPIHEGTARFDLTLAMSETSDALVGAFEYDSGVFSSEDIARLSENFLVMLRAMTAGVGADASSLPIVSATDRDTLRATNATDEDYPRDVTIDSWVELSAERAPGDVAIVDERGDVSYGQLAARLLDGAARLRALGVRPGVRVGICVDRTGDMVVAMLAVLRAGGTYVAIDPEFPAQRIEWMVHDAAMAFVLTDETTAHTIAGIRQVCLSASDATEAVSAGLDASSPRERAHGPEDAAYVLYTSGSTGLPKGVVVSHRSVVNLLSTMATRPGLGPGDVMLAITTLSFDISVLELLLPLVVGARLWIAGRDVARDPRLLASLSATVRPTVMQATPTMWRLLIQAGWQGGRDLKVLSGGEALDSLLAHELLSRCSSLWNMYGPTETTIWSCRHEVRDVARTIPIGAPVGNTRVYVVDRQLRPVPVNVIGEIAIGGLGVACGYLNRPELTAERFVADPMGLPGARMYCTGDYGRLLPDGRLVYEGREDGQIKVRGHRVELGEIDAVLARAGGVRHSAVIASQDATSAAIIVAYVVLENGVDDGSDRDLARYLRERLPSHMLPADIVRLQALPQTANGKLDRRALREARRVGDHEVVRPRTPIEEWLAQQWASLLGLDAVGVTADFFALGGHSLLAIQLAQRIQERTGVELPLRVLFEHPTVETVATAIERSAGAVSRRHPIEPSACRESFPLSFQQERLWFLHQLAPSSTAYSMVGAVDVRGRVDPALIEQAWNELVARHEALRMVFAQTESGAVQRVSPAPCEFSFENVEASQIEGRLERLAATPFDLSARPPVRALLLRSGPETAVLALAIHHIAADGWSVELLRTQLAQVYEALLTHRALPPRPQLGLQYGDYARWQRTVATDAELQRGLEFFARELAHAPAVLALPADGPRRALATGRAGTVAHTLSPDERTALEQLCRVTDATRFSVFMGAFAGVLASWAGADDLVIGTAVANRALPELERIVGMIANTLPIRIRSGPAASLSALVDEAKQRLVGALSHQHVPFERIVEKVGARPDLTRHPLFQAMLVVQQEQPEKAAGEATFGPPVTFSASARFDLALHVSERPDAFQLRWDFDSDLFMTETVEALARQFRMLLVRGAAEPQRPVRELQLVDDRMRAEMLAVWGRGARRHVPPGTVVDAFERIAATAGDQLAVEGAEQRLTYAQLNGAANRLARCLRARGVGRESVVVVQLARSPRYVVSILAVAKAGAAFVPVAAPYPAERLRRIVHETRASCCITEGTSAVDGEAGGHPPLRLNLDETDLATYPDGNLETGCDSTDLAYIIYTSGSTGRPKGVRISHAGLSNLVGQPIEGFAPGARTLQLASVGFDATIWEIFLSLTNGSTLCIHAPSHFSSPDLYDYLKRERISCITITPSVLRVLESEALPDLKVVYSVGERCTPDVVGRWSVGRRLINAYGPTEATVCATTYACTGAEAHDAPIGRPIANAAVQVLDEDLNPVPVGVPGELFISGAGVARDYAGQPDQTAWRFVPNPFSEVPGARMYRSGDLVRWRADGQLGFVGRVDRQIKVRGHRIEPGEVEDALLALSGVRTAAVVGLTRDGAIQALHAFITTDEPRCDEQATSDRVRAALSQALPANLVPARVGVLDALPLNASGKADYALLERLARDSAAAELAPIAPRGRIETVLAEIWCELLGLASVGANASFFDLGGHSLLASQCVSRVRQRLGKALAIQSVFEAETLGALAERVVASADVSSELGPRASAADGRAAPPLSHSQEGIWLAEQLLPEGTQFHVSAILRLVGRLDIDALRDGIRSILERHEVLRARFVMEEEHVVQRVAAVPEDPLRIVDLRGLAPAEGSERSLSVARDAATAVFDLERGPLYRMVLIRVGDEECLFAVTLHHIVADGWSVGILVRELARAYGALAQGGSVPPAEPGFRYADFATWQRSADVERSVARGLAFWREYMSGAPDSIDLFRDVRGSKARTGHGGRVRSYIDPAAYESVVKLARHAGTSPFTVLLSALATLLGRQSGDEDIVIGTAVAGRTFPVLENLVGCFVNMLPIRVKLGGDPTFAELLARARESTLSALERQDVPFERIVETIGAARSGIRAPLFQVAFVFQNIDVPVFQLSGLQAQAVEFHPGGSKYDLLVDVKEQGSGFECSWEYASDVFSNRAIAQLAAQFGVLVRSIGRDADRRLASLDFMDADDEAAVFAMACGPLVKRRHVCIHELVERQVDRTPDAIAVEYDGQVLTYRELDEQAEGIAQALRALDVGPETPVAVHVERSVAMVAAVLGILKAGGAYVPLEPALPLARKAVMLDEASIGVVLTTSSHAAPPFDRVRGVDLGEIAPQSRRNGAHRPSPAGSNAAYIIYTSGSTGCPKGAVNTHAALVNRVLWMQEALQLQPNDRVLHKTPLGFDVSVWELFWPLVVGARLVVAPPNAHRDIDELVGVIRRTETTHMHFVPTMLQAFLGHEAAAACRTLRCVVASGEALTSDMESELLDRLPECKLYNLYGPTEAAVDVTWWDCRRRNGLAGSPIGHPIANVGAHVLSPNLRIAPVNAVGELYITGIAVARGYVGRPDLSAERFLPDPWGNGGCMYRTGDLVRRLEDGTLLFLRRADEQIKIGGVRIEPAEIESLMLRHPGVREAAVVLDERESSKRLIACYCGAEDVVASREELATFVRRYLPTSMLPSAFWPIDAMPRTSSGKLDRRALVASIPRSRASLPLAPRTRTESLIAECFAELLGVDVAGVGDNFFELGGQSLLATRLVSRVRAELGVGIALHEIFEHPTVEALAAAIDRLRVTPDLSAIATERADTSCQASAAQERLWRFEQVYRNTGVYNMPLVVRLDGNVEPAAVDAALRWIAARHDPLRTVLRLEGDRVMQVVLSTSPFDVDVVDLSGWHNELRVTECDRLLDAAGRRPFDLTHGPVLRALMLRLSAASHLLQITIHHVAADGWSLNIFMRELVGALGAALRGERPAAPALPIRYRDYAVWQRRYLASGAEATQLAYWRAQLAGLPQTRFAADRPRPRQASFSGATMQFEIPSRHVAALEALAQSHASTLFMGLLSVLYTMLHRYTLQNDLVVGTDISGRHHAGTEDLIGFFVNQLAIRTTVDGDDAFVHVLEKVRSAVLGAMANQDVSFDELASALTVRRDDPTQPLFNVKFVLQDAVPDAIAVEGLRVEVVSRPGGCHAKFDLLFVVVRSGGRWDLLVEYRTDLFDATTVDGLGRCFAYLVGVAAADPDTPVWRLRLYADPPTRAPSSAPQLATSIPAVFQAIAERYPHRAAIATGDERITYEQLERRTEALARRLRRVGVGPERRVGVFLSRSVQAIEAVLAIVKAGGSYVPLDPGYPLERTERLISQAGLAVIVSSADLEGELPVGHYEVVDIDACESDVDGHPDDRRSAAVRPENEAYVMFTSGSTGGPKGVSVPHRAVLRLVVDTSYVRFAADEVVLQAAPLTFDASTFEIWGALLNGACLAVYPPAPIAARELQRTLQEQGVTTCWLTAGLFHELADSGTSFEGLRQLVVGGDVVSARHVRRVMDGAPGLLVFNGYGPTENTTFSLVHEVESGHDPEFPIPIGRAIRGTLVYVLDAELVPVPDGMVGELFVAGDGLARGYLAAPDATAGAFLPDPFAQLPGARMYRTGDLVRSRAAGTLEFVGRQDLQVKVRGYRIELEEVEAVLSEHPRVQRAVAAVHRGEAADKALIAFVVTHDGTLTDEELRSHVAATLPAFMVPSVFHIVTSLPLTAHGKVDRKALMQQLPALAPPQRHRPTPPQTDLQRALVEVWSEVLSLDGVGIDDNFYALGGDSIRLIRVAAACEARGIVVAAENLHACSTIRELEEVVRSTRDASPPPTPVPAPVVRFTLLQPADRARVSPELEDAMPATSLQTAMLFHSLHSGEEALYHDAFSIRLHGRLDRERLSRALRQVVARHGVLRTSFAVSGFKEVVQLVHRPDDRLVDVGFHELSDRTPDEQERHLRGWLEENRKRPFDWESAPLFRLDVHALDESACQLTLVFHHAILDGWSVSLLFVELFRRYEALLDGDAQPSPAPALTYAAHVALERDALARPDSRQFWSDQLRRLDGEHCAWLSGADAFGGEATFGKVRVELRDALADDLKRVARSLDVPLRSVLLACHLRVLGVLKGTRAVASGVVVSCRPEVAGGDRVLGLFINSLPLVHDLTDEIWAELIRSTHRVERDISSHRRFPTAKLKELNAGRPLFDALFNYTDFHAYEELSRSTGLRVHGQPRVIEKLEMPLAVTFGIEPLTSQLALELSFDRRTFDDLQVDAIASLYRRLLDEIAVDPGARCVGCCVLAPDDRRRILQTWNDTYVPPAGPRRVHEAIAEQVRRTPDRAALVFRGRELTYAELEQRANALAVRLRGLGVQPGAPVLLCTPRSLEMVIGMVGILKAGASYVPIAPEYPAVRIDAVRADIGARVVVTTSELATRFADMERIVAVDADAAETACAPELQPVDCDSPAYVLYTSGSTGTPKGVVVTHGNLLNHFSSMYERFAGHAHGRWLATTNYTFDISAVELLWTLTVGFTVVVHSRSHAPGESIPEQIEEHGITHLQLTPSEASMLLLLPAAQRALKRLRCLMLIGESLRADLADRLRQALTGQLFNNYGPTETTIWSTSELVGSTDPVSIGRPIANTEVYVLDEEGAPLPVGLAGELYIGGAGVSWCYWRDPALTASRFVPDPFSGRAGARLYRTGDFARFLPDGRIEFLGRRDGQVKMRGHRIELGEIEHQLRRLGGVHDACARVWRPVQGDDRLVAYVVRDRSSAERAGADERSWTEGLAGALREILPPYMVPSFIIELGNLPVTSSGKLDRRALPEPKLAVGSAHTPPPRSGREQALAALWAEVLSLDEVSVTANFFDLGGSSITLAKLHYEMSTRLGVQLPIAELFANPTVRDLAARLERSPQDVKTSVEEHDAVARLREGRSRLGRLKGRQHG